MTSQLRLRWLRFVPLFICGSALLAGLAISVRAYLFEKRFAFPPRSSVDGSLPESFGLVDARLVEYVYLGNAKIRGWYVPTRNGASIVFVHGTGGNRTSLAHEAAILTREGYGALLVDLPGQGKSDGNAVWGTPEEEAIIAGVDWLATQEGSRGDRIGGYGFSVGSHVLALAAARHQRIRAVVLTAASPSIESRIEHLHRHWGTIAALAASLAFLEAGTNPWHPSTRDVIATIAPRPILLIAGDKDELVPGAQTRELFALAKEPKMLEFFPCGHGKCLSADSGRYEQLLLAFFDQHLLHTATDIRN